jgi:hypothetical protein
VYSPGSVKVPTALEGIVPCPDFIFGSLSFLSFPDQGRLDSGRRNRRGPVAMPSIKKGVIGGDRDSEIITLTPATPAVTKRSWISLNCNGFSEATDVPNRKTSGILLSPLFGTEA